MNKYLLIGGTGVIGHFVTRRIVEAGNRPVVLNVSGDSGLIADVRNHCTLVRGDVTDGAGIERVVREHAITHIAHMGSILHSVTEQNPPLALRVGGEGTANVLEAARVNGVKRVVFCSSKAVYGPVSGDYAHPVYKPLDEDRPPAPASMYGIAKLAGENVGRWYKNRHGIEFVALRFGSTVGPGKLRRHAGTSVHSLIVEGALAGKPVNIPKGGDAVTDTVFNDDVARGILCALHAPAPRSTVFNIASGAGITLHDFAAAVRRRIPKADITIGPGPEYLRADSAGHCILDIGRARAELGYAPSYDVDRMVYGYIAAMQRLGLAPAA